MGLLGAIFDSNGFGNYVSKYMACKNIVKRLPLMTDHVHSQKKPKLDVFDPGSLMEPKKLCRT